jgi:hypothetical protein
MVSFMFCVLNASYHTLHTSHGGACSVLTWVILPTSSHIISVNIMLIFDEIVGCGTASARQGKYKNILLLPLSLPQQWLQLSPLQACRQTTKTTTTLQGKPNLPVAAAAAASGNNGHDASSNVPPCRASQTLTASQRFCCACCPYSSLSSSSSLLGEHDLQDILCKHPCFHVGILVVLRWDVVAAVVLLILLPNEVR